MTTRDLTAIDNLANGYLQSQLDMNPELVTWLGMPGADESGYQDYSPAGYAAFAELNRTTLAELAKLQPVDETDRVTKAAMQQELSTQLEFHDLGEIGDLNNIATPLQGVAEIFDNMPQETASDWELIAARMANAPRALTGWRQTLTERAKNGPDLATRQIEICIEQAKANAAPDSPLAALAQRAKTASPELAEKVDTAAQATRAAYADLATFLADVVAPHGVATDAFGRERYELRLYDAIGATVDLDETYEWGITELNRIIDEQKVIARELYGDGVSVREAMDRLNNDPARQLHSTEELRNWMQDTSDRALDALSGTHFDIPEPLRKLECMIAPSGTGAIYYTGPTADFSRGGRMWWSVPHGTDTFTTWQEKTTVYHEGVPGHHLQIGYTTYLKDQLNNWRRHGSWKSGHGEGWALYAEGLMVELGFMDDLGDRMGVLDGERLRAARVVLDIGVHTQKPAPAAYQHISPIWNRDVAWEFLKDNVAMDHSFLSFELNRYLGWAGQAPSYKIGHRLWKEMRADAAAREGANFDLKAWHTKALSLGSMGLDVIREALAR
ncbi:DUF885 domain-containing protein [Arcanobacterium bovis]|uniref:DUF885 domain-containing protein n=1 Tax=Arcanobacterium bovis TaxID=2529275 RepID=A0A4Q9V228_9ACTO|nr:DUF885 domain-containing protein [Arcanobacterium bovis]TBW23650.1 DUF885 domain-containing protein [Arcanobacterium bovis]